MTFEPPDLATPSLRDPSTDEHDAAAVPERRRPRTKRSRGAGPAGTRSGGPAARRPVRARGRSGRRADGDRRVPAVGRRRGRDRAARRRAGLERRPRSRRAPRVADRQSRERPRARARRADRPHRRQRCRGDQRAGRRDRRQAADPPPRPVPSAARLGAGSRRHRPARPAVRLPLRRPARGGLARPVSLYVAPTTERRRDRGLRPREPGRRFAPDLRRGGGVAATRPRRPDQPRPRPRLRARRLHDGARPEHAARGGADGPQPSAHPAGARNRGRGTRKRLRARRPADAGDQADARGTRGPCRDRHRVRRRRRRARPDGGGRSRRSAPPLLGRDRQRPAIRAGGTPRAGGRWRRSATARRGPRSPPGAA